MMRGTKVLFEGLTSRRLEINFYSVKIAITWNMEQTQTISNSSSFEDLAKDNEAEAADEGFMDILGNQQLTKKVGQFAFVSQLHS